MNGRTLTHKLIQNHLVDGQLKTGERVGIKIDQTLTHDVNGIMAYLEFEALQVQKIQGDIAVSYIDHNLLQADFKNPPDDHRFLMDMAKRYGAVCSKMGNGICHQLHVERFALPGKTLLGSDSHTPASGGVGALAIGAGGMDVAVAMAGEPFYFQVPKVIKVVLTGELPPHLTIKNVNLELLRRLSVKGAVGAALEYAGSALKHLNVSQRATLCNMGAETGATTSIFPSDEVTHAWLKAQNRQDGWLPLAADEDAQYDEIIEIDLATIQALIALPHQPDKVVLVSEVQGLPVDQIVLGGCTNASLQDVLWMAHLIEGKTIADNVDAGLYCGSQQVMREALQRGAIEKMVAAGVRIFEMFCGACNGMGFAPPTQGVSLRTGPRHFEGRSGNPTGQVYLVAPETAIASGISGKITDPKDIFRPGFTYQIPQKFIIDDSRFICPENPLPKDMEIRRGPNIRPLPQIPPMQPIIKGEVLLHLDDDITTDHIVPAGANFLPIRNNIPEIAKHSFRVVDLTFPARAQKAKRGIIVAGKNYGQGSSREQAAMVPRYLGIEAIVAESFARIHLANLVNFGILPLLFANSADRALFLAGAVVNIDTKALQEGQTYQLINQQTGATAELNCLLTQDELEIIRAGGRLNSIRARK